MLLTQAELARKLGWSKTKLNELIHGKRRITANTALDLAKTLGTSAWLWMNLQDSWESDLAQKKRNS
jgi:antitoxin HigA-1